jgi:hypothetical protein
LEDRNNLSAYNTAYNNVVSLFNTLLPDYLENLSMTHSPTISQLRLAACKKLPDKPFHVPANNTFHWHTKNAPLNKRWPEVRETEWLYICVELLEPMMAENEFSIYCVKIHSVCCPLNCSSPTCGYAISATADQRLLALWEIGFIKE